MRIIFLLLLLRLTASHGQQDCFEGKKYPMPKLSEAARDSHTLKLLHAVSAYTADSTNADNIIWFGRRWAYLGEYEKAITVFSKGISLHPGDARMYRHRGHRYITLRCFDKAIADLKKAGSLIKGKDDEIEPDGIPNEKNIPTSTLQSNIWYHLGLAYFIKGDYRKASKTYKKCQIVSKNDDMYIATYNWHYLTLLRLGKSEKAKDLHYSVKRNPVIENIDYLQLYYNLYDSKPFEKEVDAAVEPMLKIANPLGMSTKCFATGFYCQIKGYTEKAKEYFNKAVATGQWSSFGYIAAEAILNRLKHE